MTAPARVLPLPLYVSARDVQTQLGCARSTAYEHLRRAGVRLEIVAAFLGHTTTAMVTRVYGRLDGAGLGAAIVQQTGADRADSGA